MQSSALIVDDHAAFRAVARVLLEDLGYAVLEAADGASAIATAIDMQPDLVD